MADEKAITDRDIRLWRARLREAHPRSIEILFLKWLGWLALIPQRWLKWMNVASGTFFSFILVFFIAGNLDRSDPYEIEGIAISPVSAGGFLQITIFVDADTTRNCSRATSRWVVDSKGTRFPLPFVAVAAPEDIKKRRDRYKVTLIFDLPISAASGEAKYISKSQYICNPAQAYWPIEVTEEVAFEIL